MADLPNASISKRMSAAEYRNALHSAISVAALKKQDEKNTQTRLATEEFLKWLNGDFALNFSEKMDIAVNKTIECPDTAARNSNEIRFWFFHAPVGGEPTLDILYASKEIKQWFATYLNSFEADGWFVKVCEIEGVVYVIMSYEQIKKIPKIHTLFYSTPPKLQIRGETK